MSDNTFEILGKVAREATQDLLRLHKATTFCTRLAHEVMGLKSTEHFQHLDTSWTTDGAMALYKCSLDGRTYKVHITTDDV